MNVRNMWFWQKLASRGILLLPAICFGVEIIEIHIIQDFAQCYQIDEALMLERMEYQGATMGSVAGSLAQAGWAGGPGCHFGWAELEFLGWPSTLAAQL